MTTTIGQALHDTRDDLAADYAAGGVAIILAAGQGAKYAAATVTAPYAVRIDDELLIVTGRSTDTLTVVGAQGPTIAANHVAGIQKVQPILTAVDWQALRGLALTLEATTALPLGTSTPSASTLTLPSTGTLIPITSTTGITDIVVQGASRFVALQFAASLTVTNGNHLKLNGDYTTVAGDILLLVSDGSNWYELARRGGVVRTANTASATTVTLPAGRQLVVPITGTTTITSITATTAGTIARLEFASAACQVTNGSNLKLASNYISTLLGTLTLGCDGTNWVEQARTPPRLTTAANLVVAGPSSGSAAMETARALVAADLAAPPACRVYPSAVQSIASGGSGTAIAYDAEDFDTDNMHDTVTLNTRITVKTAGRYIFGASSGWVANATGLRAIWLSRNGAGRLAEYDFAGSATGGTSMIATAPTQMAVNDYIEVFAFQASGIALNVSGSGNSTDVFWAVRIGS